MRMLYDAGVECFEVCLEVKYEEMMVVVAVEGVGLEDEFVLVDLLKDKFI